MSIKFILFITSFIFIASLIIGFIIYVFFDLIKTPKEDDIKEEDEFIRKPRLFDSYGESDPYDGLTGIKNGGITAYLLLQEMDRSTKRYD